MRLARSFALLILLAGGLLSGCKSNCQKLSEKLCDCAANSQVKQSCISRAASEASLIGSDAAAEKFCSGLLNACDCHILSTLTGKRACGLAR